MTAKEAQEIASVVVKELGGHITAQAVYGFVQAAILAERQKNSLELKQLRKEVKDLKAQLAPDWTRI